MVTLRIIHAKNQPPRPKTVAYRLRTHSHTDRQTDRQREKARNGTREMISSKTSKWSFSPSGSTLHHSRHAHAAVSNINRRNVKGDHLFLFLFSLSFFPPCFFFFPQLDFLNTIDTHGKKSGTLFLCPKNNPQQQMNSFIFLISFERIFTTFLNRKSIK